MIFVVVQCLNQFVGKALFIRHPTMQLSQLIILRSIFSIIIFAIIMNKKIRTILGLIEFVYESLALYPGFDLILAGFPDIIQFNFDSDNSRCQLVSVLEGQPYGHRSQQEWQIVRKAFGYQLWTFRGTTLLVPMNKKIKYYMYDTIPRAQYRTLFFRCVQGGFGFMCLYTCIKYFPLVFVSLVQNIAPLLIALFSYYFYSVGLSRHDMVILMLSFIGVIVLITGSLDSNEEAETTEGEYSTSQLIIPALCLIVIPFNTATVRLFMRSLKDLNELTLGALIVTAMLILYLPIVVIFYGFEYLDTFDNTDWGICVLLGFTSSTLQVLMAKSIQYEEPARLAVLNYFQPIIQLVLDVIFLHNIFTGQQMLGAGIIFVANSASWVFKVQKAFFSEKKVVEAPGNTQVDEEGKSSRQKD